MEKAEITEDENSRLILISAIPMIIFSVSAFFLYLLPQRANDSSMDKVVETVSLFVLVFLPSAFSIFAMTFEILYHRKIRKTLTFHVKRFFGRVILSAVFALLLTATVNILYRFLFPLISITLVVTSALLITAVTLGVIVWKFRNFFSRLDKG